MQYGVYQIGFMAAVFANHKNQAKSKLGHGKECWDE